MHPDIYRQRTVSALIRRWAEVARLFTWFDCCGFGFRHPRQRDFHRLPPQDSGDEKPIYAW
jgi:hypothetical protein